MYTHLITSACKCKVFIFESTESGLDAVSRMCRWLLFELSACSGLITGIVGFIYFILHIILYRWLSCLHCSLVRKTFVFKMLFMARIWPPTSVPLSYTYTHTHTETHTLRQFSDTSCYNSVKWASPYIINGFFESHRAYCCERGRREVASVGTCPSYHLSSFLQIFLYSQVLLSSAQCVSLFIFFFFILSPLSSVSNCSSVIVLY